LGAFVAAVIRGEGPKHIKSVKYIMMCCLIRVRCVNGIFFLSRGPGMLARDEQITASWPGGVESDH
jgi:hypothetical protein